jgi:hypothetical protein
MAGRGGETARAIPRLTVPAGSAGWPAKPSDANPGASSRKVGPRGDSTRRCSFVRSVGRSVGRPLDRSLGPSHAAAAAAAAALWHRRRMSPEDAAPLPACCARARPPRCPAARGRQHQGWTGSWPERRSSTDEREREREQAVPVESADGQADTPRVVEGAPCRRGTGTRSDEGAGSSTKYETRQRWKDPMHCTRTLVPNRTPRGAPRLP